jgi:hypothetical protein
LNAMFDTFHPLDAAGLWCAIGTLDLLRTVGRIEELLRMGCQGRRELASESGIRRIHGRSAPVRDRPIRGRDSPDRRGRPRRIPVAWPPNDAPFKAPPRWRPRNQASPPKTVAGEIKQA